MIRHLRPMMLTLKSYVSMAYHASDSVKGHLRGIMDDEVRAFSEYVRKGMEYNRASQVAVHDYLGKMKLAKEDIVLPIGVRTYSAIVDTSRGRHSKDTPSILRMSSSGGDAISARTLRNRMEKFLIDSTNDESDRSIRRYAGIVTEALSKSPVVNWEDMSNSILERGLADNVGRADSMSKILCTWAANEGAVAVFDEMGIRGLKWYSVLGDTTCEWCRSLHGMRTVLGTPFLLAGSTYTTSNGSTKSVPFDVMHAPLHPECLCTVEPEEVSTL